jgi:hypothetical protein
MRDPLHECHDLLSDIGWVVISACELVDERKPGEHVGGVEYLGAVGAGMPGPGSTRKQDSETSEPARVSFATRQRASPEHRHRVEPPQQQAMGGVEIAEDDHEPLQGGNRVGLPEGFGQSSQASRFREVIEDGLDERFATAKTIVDRDSSNSSPFGDGFEGERVAADQDLPGSGEDPGAGGIHTGATLFELIRARTHPCISAYTVYAVKREPPSEPGSRRGVPMTLYAFALFVHIVGALLLSTAFTAEGIGLFHLRRATSSAGVRQWEGVAGLARVFGPASVVTILASGLYMMVTSWGWVPWLAIGLFAWVVIAVLGAVNGIRMSVTVRQSVGGAPPGTGLQSRAFLISWLTRLSIAAGIVFLMTNKPDLVPALLCILVAAAVGVAAGFAVTRKANPTAVVGRPDPTGR